MPAKSAVAAKKPASKAAPTVSGSGVYIGKVDVRNQTAEEVRERFSAHGPIAQVRVKRNQQGNGPYALIWYKSADDAKKAITELRKNEPEGTVVEPIKKAAPVQPRSNINTTIAINPINVPPRDTKAYGELSKKVRAALPGSIKTRLLKEKNNTGTALVYFKDHADAAAAQAKIDKTFLGYNVTVKPSLRTLEHDKRSFVEPLVHAAEFAKKKAVKDAAKAKKDADAKKLAEAATKKRQEESAAKKKAAEAAAAADAKKKAAAKKEVKPAADAKKADAKKPAPKAPATAKAPAAKPAKAAGKPAPKGKAPAPKKSAPKK